MTSNVTEKDEKGLDMMVTLKCTCTWNRVDSEAGLILKQEENKQGVVQWKAVNESIVDFWGDMPPRRSESSNVQSLCRD